MQTVIWELASKVFGLRDGIGSGKGFDGLAYLIRRYGYTAYGSDDYKQLCYYAIPTKIDGFYVTVSFGGRGFRMGFTADEPIYTDLLSSSHIILEGWDERVLEEAKKRGVGFVPRSPAVWDRWEMGEWYETTYNDEFIANDGDIEDNKLTGQGEQHVMKWLSTVQENYGEEWRTHAESLRAKRKEFVKMAELEWGMSRDTGLEAHRNHPVFSQYIDAYQEVIESWLNNPVWVRDILINFLGEYDSKKWGDLWNGEKDEEIEGKIANWSTSAGYGVPPELTKTPDEFLRALSGIRRAGYGDFHAGTNRLLKGIPTAFAVGMSSVLILALHAWMFHSAISAVLAISVQLFLVLWTLIHNGIVKQTEST